MKRTQLYGFFATLGAVFGIIGIIMCLSGMFIDEIPLVFGGVLLSCIAGSVFWYFSLHKDADQS